MSKNSRNEEILQLVNSRGVISVGELSEKIYASRSTIRRDLEKLERQGLLRRHHGGAESVLSPLSATDSAVSVTESDFFQTEK